jgi:FtsP/CotA-like multicopper oxidase with cupredoxin domain
MATFSVNAAAGWAAITFINTGGISGLEISIDSHKMYVYAADGRYIEPQLVDALTIFNGERYSVLIKLDQEVGQYAIRVPNVNLNQVISGFAVLSYAGSTGPSSTATAAINYAGVNTTANFTPFVPALAVPFPNNPPPAVAEATHIMDITKTDTAYTWTLGGIESFNMSLENLQPLLFNKSAPLASDSNLVWSTTNGTWVDIIIQVAGPLAEPHPIHKHSNKAYIIGTGLGPFGYTDVAAAIAAEPESFNLVNPPFRDGFTTTPAEGNSSWTAIRYQVVNPGAFFLHCHVQTHLSGGMAQAILDGTDKWPTVPEVYLNGNNGITSKAKSSKKGT